MNGRSLMVMRWIIKSEKKQKHKFGEIKRRNMKPNRHFRGLFTCRQRNWQARLSFQFNWNAHGIKCIEIWSKQNTNYNAEFIDSGSEIRSQNRKKLKSVLFLVCLCVTGCSENVCSYTIRIGFGIRFVRVCACVCVGRHKDKVNFCYTNKRAGYGTLTQNCEEYTSRTRISDDRHWPNKEHIGFSKIWNQIRKNKQHSKRIVRFWIKIRFSDIGVKLWSEYI